MSAISTQDGKKVIFFGGQDSEKGIVYNELFTLDTATFTLKHHEYADDEIQPAPRNSHTLA